MFGCRRSGSPAFSSVGTASGPQLGTARGCSLYSAAWWSKLFRRSKVEEMCEDLVEVGTWGFQVLP